MHIVPTTPIRLYLASTSPRRRQLLEALGLPFHVVRTTDEEKHPSVETLEEILKENAESKAKMGFAQCGDDKGLSIGADTLVAVNETVLGKPRNPADVVAMLRALSGRSHKVMTGVALVTANKVTHFVETSEVVFRTLTDQEIVAYSRIQEPYDKAGSYAVQGASCVFIEKIVGSYTNVMGLPTERLLKQLELHTGIPIFEWFPGHK